MHIATGLGTNAHIVHLHSFTVEPRLADTPEKRTPRLCGHFLKSQQLALFYLYKLPFEMRTPCYSVLWTTPCAPPYTTLYKTSPNNPDISIRC